MELSGCPGLRFEQKTWLLMFIGAVERLIFTASWYIVEILAITTSQVVTTLFVSSGLMVGLGAIEGNARADCTGFLILVQRHSVCESLMWSIVRTEMNILTLFAFQQGAGDGSLTE